METNSNNSGKKIDLKNIIVIFPNGEQKTYPRPLVLSDLLNLPCLSSKDIVALKVNGEIKSLNAITINYNYLFFTKLFLIIY